MLLSRIPSTRVCLKDDPAPPLEPLDDGMVESLEEALGEMLGIGLADEHPDHVGAPDDEPAPDDGAGDAHAGDAAEAPSVPTSGAPLSQYLYMQRATQRRT